jgi:hypothetical protein
MVVETRKELDKTMPKEKVRQVHAGAKRGRAAIIARRLAKKPKIAEMSGPAVNEALFNRWAAEQFEPTRF